VDLSFFSLGGFAAVPILLAFYRAIQSEELIGDNVLCRGRRAVSLAAGRPDGLALFEESVDAFAEAVGGAQLATSLLRFDLFVPRIQRCVDGISGHLCEAACARFLDCHDL
jgi:hypothetical protein